MTTLLLVDSKIPQYSEFVAAVKSDIDIVPFDSATHTLSGILANITTIAAGRQFSTVGIVQEGTDIMVEYKIVQNQKPADITSIESWSDIQAFFASLKATFGIQTIDLISCNLWKNPKFADAMTKLESQVGVNIRASTNPTGNLAQGGDWMQESDNVNIRDVYFTDAISNFTHLLYRTYDKSNAVLTNGKLASVVAWGSSSNGGSIPAEKYNDMSNGITAIYSNEFAFAALTANGTVVTWGHSNRGGDSSAVSSQLTDVSSIYSTNYSFAALKTNGSVVTWGDGNWGGDSSAVSSQLTNVISISSTPKAFAALKTNGSVVTWGVAGWGGNSSAVSSQLTDVSAIYSTTYSFAALKSNGTVVTWGDAGGDSTDVSSQLINVSAIYSTSGSFAAVKSDRTVVTWGSAYVGGDSTAVSSQLTDVSAIYSTPYAFAALKSNGTVVTWGNTSYGGNSSAVSSQLTDVSAIYSTNYSFAALKTNGSVVTWGDGYLGGDSSAVSSQLTDVSAIYSTINSFAALKKNGSVVTWWDGNWGGDSSAVSSQLTNVISISSTPYAFAALKSNGTVVTWGHTDFGGNSSAVSSQLTSRIIGVASSGSAFAALRELVRYTITFNGNGFKGTLPANIICIQGESVQLATTLSRTDYAFSGWALTRSGSVLSNSYTPTEDVTLYAIWIKTDNFTVTYSNSASGTSGRPPLDNQGYSSSSYAVVMANQYTRSGYTFSGWMDPSGNLYQSGNHLYFTNADITLTAAWKANLTMNAPTVTNTSGVLDFTVSYSRPLLAATNTPVPSSVPVTYSITRQGSSTPLVSSLSALSFTGVAPVGAFTFTVTASITDPAYMSSVSATSAVTTFTSNITSATTTGSIQTGISNTVSAGGTLQGAVSAAMSSPAVSTAPTVTAAAITIINLAAGSNLLVSQAAVQSAIKGITMSANDSTAVAAVASLTTSSATISALVEEFGGRTFEISAAEMTSTITVGIQSNGKTATSDFQTAVATAPTDVIVPDASNNIVWSLTNTTNNIYFPTEYNKTYNITFTNATGGLPITETFTLSQNSVTKALTINSTTYALGDSFTKAGVTLVYGLAGSAGFTQQSQNSGAVCFLGSAPVLTPAGYRRIDCLAVGDMVRTADGRDVAIQRVKHQRVVTPSASVNPYVIPAGQFGATETLAISPRHCVAVPGRGMIEARDLGLRQMSMRTAFDYYNLELPEWDNMVVAGVEVESLAPTKRVTMTAAQFRGLVGSRSMDMTKLAQFANVLADGRVEVALTRKARRM